MSSEARLRALRLVGFKSFAERTVVEFGSGISAIVGPNGSGKSNLADALRWALGEQGRSLRTRKSEDVIFAGSASRQATGMADVTLVIANEDRLLPIDYAEIDLGRRLYRSGENEYLLNRQRVRLRDVVELLEAANLADNAFLFIGQGMVDQALSLRPEERRPLFEEVAGVRRHERRRRQAEAQLAEAEDNLERVRDILAELRPQARRLAAQAEQQAARRDAGQELAQALIEAARQRWLAAHRTTQQGVGQLEAARAAADAALAELRTAEESAGAIARALAERAAAEREARAGVEAAQGTLTERRLQEQRRRSDKEAAERERERLLGERGTLEGRITDARRILSGPVPERDLTLADELAAAERAVTVAGQELEGLREVRLAADQREAAVRRAIDAREAEQERARRAAEAAAESARSQREQAEAAAAEVSLAAERMASAREEARTAAERESEAEGSLEAARAALEAADGTLESRLSRARALRTTADEARVRLEAIERELAQDDARSLIQAARRRGGRPIAEGLDVDPASRSAVQAALGAALRGVVTDGKAALDLKGERGVLLLVAETLAEAGAAGASAEAVAGPPAGLLDAVLAAGGGRLAEAVRRDAEGVVRRLLARVLWVPDLDDALRLRDQLPIGWRLVTSDGVVVDADGLLELGRGEPLLGRQADRDALAADLATAAEAASAADEEAEQARADEAHHRRSLEEARRAVEGARGRRRAADEAQRVAERRHETASREASWAQSQAARLAEAAERAAEAVRPLETASQAGDSPGAQGAGGDGASLAPLEQRLREARDAHGRIAARARAEEAQLRAAEDRRRRADISLAIDEARLRELERELAGHAERAARSGDALARLAGEMASAAETRDRAQADLEALLAADTEQRAKLSELESQAATARERLRASEERTRLAERAELEGRLQLEAAREQLLVELASLGPVGLRVLEGSQAQPTPVAEEELAVRLESALDAATLAWQSAEAAGEDQPVAPPASLATLRRRYHELGASNPFAAEEYEELKARLESLEAQRSDLESAIAGARELIAELTTLMTARFRATFAALEQAFARQFEELFAGGDANLELTDPDDLAATGIEISARPPGKKRQPLAMLSGGERALTAVALLFAMLEVRPVPFCVLDEVDAALDEANISRFADSLERLAERTQFIVITHNRGTIERADALYGVTIGDDAVSRIISIRLSDVRLPADLVMPSADGQEADRAATPT
jgi:chromosome segregation protein